MVPAKNINHPTWHRTWMFQIGRLTCLQWYLHSSSNCRPWCSWNLLVGSDLFKKDTDLMDQVKTATHGTTTWTWTNEQHESAHSWRFFGSHTLKLDSRFPTVIRVILDFPKIKLRIMVLEKFKVCEPMVWNHGLGVHTLTDIKHSASTGWTTAPTENITDPT